MTEDINGIRPSTGRCRGFFLRFREDFTDARVVRGDLTATNPGDFLRFRCKNHPIG